MGEAKRRGTYAERKAAAIKRDGIEREERLRHEHERIAAMTEEERERRRDSAGRLAYMVALAQSMGTYHYRLP